MEVRIKEFMPNICPLDRLTHLNSGTLQLLQNYLLAASLINASLDIWFYKEALWSA